ncbi:molybdopterin-synthase adenylyltransferase MoeB [Betaproteobacteria bacterium SCN2]|jgi:adenylyltransferase/sulfurtransferase|nr:molybdopterin-synthase adenylyltransferase MoeB [Betaproteobacteria bacterium SCN2]
MNDNDLLRYSRHILLPQIGIEGQEKLQAGTVLIVGAGGLGCPAALYLGAAGIGRLVIADADTVDLTNLQRQIGHHTAAVGSNKALSLRDSIHAVNPGIRVEALQQRLQNGQLKNAVAGADVVLDCSDNFATRHAVNRACASLGKPLVSGAALGFSGQLSVFDVRQTDSPCYHCLFPETVEEGPRCSEAGVLSPLVGVVGAMQAVEAIKLISGSGRAAVGRLSLYDALGGEWREVRVPRDPACPVCAQR